MSSWPTGIQTIKRLLAADSLQKVSASRQAATAFLDAAVKPLDSVRTLAEEDPDGAYTLLYDAARKSLAAILQAQGLRATSSGGHYAIQEAIAAQFTKPSQRDAFRPFGRLRRTRNQIEYDEISRSRRTMSAPTSIPFRALHVMARQLTPEMPTFID